MRPEIVAWQAQTKSAELAAEKGREEAWMAKHEKEFEDKIAPIVEEMEYDDCQAPGLGCHFVGGVRSGRMKGL